jgi:hypothetical protein
MGCVSGSTAAAGLGAAAAAAAGGTNPNAAMGQQGAAAGGDAAAAAAAAGAFGEGSGGAGRDRIHLEIKPADTLHLQMTPRVSLVKLLVLDLPPLPLWCFKHVCLSNQGRYACQ